MRNLVVYFFICIYVIAVSLSCAKERSCEGCRETNKPPIALAGPDLVIILPTDSIQLDGTASNDPDGTIKNWNWKKINGPGSFEIVNDTIPKTLVRKLDTGVYKFELRVIDNWGLGARDTVQITVNSKPQVNRPPVANAGVDQKITLPVNSVSLNASGSTDPDNNIASYIWVKVSGPATFKISNANAIQPRVTDLAEGTYLFELKVTDSAGLFSKDSVMVTVENLPTAESCDVQNRSLLNASLVPFVTLSEVPWAITSTGNKLVFVYTKSMDVYDVVLNTWSKVDLSLSTPPDTYSIAVTGGGDKIFFAGGEDGTMLYDNVDIYDLSSGSWIRSKLSRAGDAFSTVACGNKVYFAGGDQGIYITSRVDIYDLATGIMSSASLSTPRNYITAFASSDKVYFTGGDPWTGQLSKVIDIYDSKTDKWSATTMQVPRAIHAGIVVDDILYLAGGMKSGSMSCSVETLNSVTGLRTSMNLFGPSSWSTYEGRNAVLKNNKVHFLRLNGIDANKFDIYDIASNTWSIGVLPQAIPQGAIPISVNNTLYVAGGLQNKQVWKLEY